MVETVLVHLVVLVEAEEDPLAVLVQLLHQLKVMLVEQVHPQVMLAAVVVLDRLAPMEPPAVWVVMV